MVLFFDPTMLKLRGMNRLTIGLFCDKFVSQKPGGTVAYSLADLRGIMSRVGLQDFPHEYIGRTFQFEMDYSGEILLLGGRIMSWSVLPAIMIQTDTEMFVFFTNVPTSIFGRSHNGDAVKLVAAVHDKLTQSEGALWGARFGDSLIRPGDLTWV